MRACALCSIAGLRAPGRGSGRQMEWRHDRRRASSIPVFLTMQDSATQLSGSISFTSNGTPAQLERIALSGGQLIFQAVDSGNHAFAFELTVSVRDMKGEAISEGKHFSVYLTPTRGPNGYERWPPGNITAPKLIYKAEPEYTDEARNARLQGTVLLYTKVTPDGRATDSESDAQPRHGPR